jgi:hypothetical protein
VTRWQAGSDEIFLGKCRVVSGGYNPAAQRELRTKGAARLAVAGNT